MPDRLSPLQRHRNMAAIRAKNTKPEMIVRKYLWSHGFRYRLNYPRLPGKPDIVLRKYRTCIFVNGCFWHGHFINDDDNDNDNRNGRMRDENLWYDNDAHRYDNDNFISLKSSDCCKIPKTNREFWVRKIMRNKERDIEVKKKLAAMGWHSITIWECELKPNNKDATLLSLVYTLNKIFLQDHKVRRYELPVEETPIMVAENNESEYGKI